MEMMVVVAITGIIGTISFNQYTTFSVRSRKAEAKTSLSRIYAAERTFFVEWLTHTACLGAMGALNSDPVRYYWSGFPEPRRVVECGVNNDYFCNVSRFDSNPPTGAPNTCDCTTATPVLIKNPDGSGTFLTQGTGTQCATDPTMNLGAPVNGGGIGLSATRGGFTAGAVGIIKRNGPPDTWTIDQDKRVRNPTQGE